MIKKLFLNQPLLTTYPEYGNLFSVIDLQNEKSLDWAFSNFNHIYVTKNNISGNYFTAYQEHLNIDYIVPTVDYLKISENIIKDKFNNSIVETIIYNINYDYFTAVMINRYFIETAKQYQKEDFLHLTLFYGYDLEKKIFYINDNILNGKYHTDEYKFSQVEDSYNKWFKENSLLSNNKGKDITVIKQVNYRDYHFNKEHLVTDLYFYLQSYEFKDTYLKHFNIINHYEACNDTIEYFDLGIYDYFKNMLDRTNKLEIDIRSFHLFHEHKKFMLERIVFLKKKNYISNEAGLYDGFRKLADVSNAILKLVIRYVLTNNKITNKKILEYLEDLKPNEEKMIKKLIQELEKQTY